MPSRDQRKNPEAEEAEAAEAEDVQHLGGLPDGALQTPEVPDISVFDNLDDDSEWYEDGDPTQEVEDNDIVGEEEFVLVGEDGAPIPSAEDALPAENDLPPAPQLVDLPPAPRVAKLPAPDEGKAEAADSDLADWASEDQDVGAGEVQEQAKPKKKGKAKGKGKAKAKGKEKGKGKAKGKAKSKAKQDAKQEAKPAPRSKRETAPAADAGSSFELGLSLRDEGQPQRAIEELTRALAAGSRAADCHKHLGLCYMDLGITTKAISSFKNALFAEDVTAEEATALRYELGRAQEREEAWDEALYYYRRVIKDDPEHRDTAVRVEKIEQLRAG